VEHGSRFLQLPARERLARLAVLELLEGLDQEYGPVSESVRSQVKRDAERIFKRNAAAEVCSTAARS